MSTVTPLNLAEFIRDIPDFPKRGILFRDITPLLQSPTAFRETIRQLAQPFCGQGIDLIAAAEARGFIFAAPLALELNAGLIPIRKPGKLPGKTLSHTYDSSMAPILCRSTPMPLSVRAAKFSWSTTCWPPAAPSLHAAR